MLKPGYNGLFVPGPTNLPPAVAQAMALPQEDLRAPDLWEFTLPLFEDLKKVFGTEAGRVLLFPSSGTGGWESALTNALSPGDRVLCATYGYFSARWAEMCERLGFGVVAVDAPWGEGAPVEEYARLLEADRERRIKAALVCHNETSTGVISDIGAVRAALDAAKHPALLFVDGVSSIASVEFRMDDWGVDVAVSGSQKGFMLPAGLGIVGVSRKAQRALERARSPRMYFDWRDMIAANETGYFPSTPATTLMRGLRASVDLLFSEGLENVHRRHRRLATGVRLAAAAWNLRLCAASPQWESDTVTAVVVPEDCDSTALIRHAYRRYNLSLGVGLARVAGRVFRIGHMGWLNELMVLQALAGSEMAMRDMGIGIDAGAGVAAAQEWFRRTAASSDPA